MKINKFISFEGIDSSGKTTQINILKKKLEDLNFKVLVLREPGGIDVSESIRKIILNNDYNISRECEMLLFLSARAELVDKVIKPALLDDSFVICDRFVDSTLAYQGYGRKIDLNLINNLNSFVTKSLLPSKSFFLDIDPTLMEERQNINDNDRMENSGKTFFKNVRNGYLEISKNDKRFVKIDASKSIEHISKEIWNQMNIFLGN